MHSCIDMVLKCGNLGGMRLVRVACSRSTGCVLYGGHRALILRAWMGGCRNVGMAARLGKVQMGDACKHVKNVRALGTALAVGRKCRLWTLHGKLHGMGGLGMGGFGMYHEWERLGEAGGCGAAAT